MPDKQFKRRINEEIKSCQVFLIDKDGQKAGVIDTAVALRRAMDNGLDLVELSPENNPPIAKIVDYSKLKYQEQQKTKKAHQQSRAQEVKDIRFRASTDEHDLEIKRKQVIKFLEKGKKVRLNIQLRGRERSHPEFAKQAVDDFVKGLDGYGVLSGKINLNNDTVTAQVNPDLKRKKGHDA